MVTIGNLGRIIRKDIELEPLDAPVPELEPTPEPVPALEPVPA